MNKATLIELCSLQEKLIKSYEEREKRLRKTLQRIAACHGNANFLANEALGNGRVAYTAMPVDE